jgi:hypothetical protein
MLSLYYEDTRCLDGLLGPEAQVTNIGEVQDPFLQQGRVNRYHFQLGKGKEQI